MSTTISSEVTEDQVDGAAPRAKPRRRLARRAVLIGVPLAAIAATGGLVAAGVIDVDYGSKPSPASSDAPAATATVKRTTLISQTQVSGTLVYAGQFSIVNRANGTLTKVPRVGKIIPHGSVLYKVDGEPVILLRGSEPAHRTLSRGMEGADVRHLNAELVALGYADSDVLDPKSKRFTWATYYALKKLQKKHGIEQTGRLKIGQAVFLDAKEIRITKKNAPVGGPAPAAAILEASSTRRQVVVALEAGQAAAVKVGDEVTVTLPDMATTPGKVASIGAVAEKRESGSPTVDVIVKLTKPDQTGRLDQAPVQVAITSDRVEDVLAVPVNALVALSGGGYALEVVGDNNARKLYPVELGLFDSSTGMVEIKGEGVTAGQKIVVPAT
ncbi:MAG: peptidoglycan-binding protein [Micromonosporaceae bacterium]|nr:peptidoglycan-binding protein [Micromonosporaceae bacterium]